MSQIVLTAVSNIMSKIGSLKKTGYNEFHKYKFAAAADLSHKLQPLLVEEGLIIMQSESERAVLGNSELLSITYAFGLLHKGGEMLTAMEGIEFKRTGLSSLRNSKGGFDDKAANKCGTAASKYFVIDLFKIPTGDFDDADDQEDRPIPAALTGGDFAPETPVSRTGGESLPPFETPVAHNDNSIPFDRSPHEIKAPTLIEWGKEFVKAIDTASDLMMLDAWKTANQDRIKEANSAATMVFKSRLEARIEKARAALFTLFLAKLDEQLKACTTREAVEKAWFRHDPIISLLGRSEHNTAVGLFESYRGMHEPAA